MKHRESDKDRSFIPFSDFFLAKIKSTSSSDERTTKTRRVIATQFGLVLASRKIRGGFKKKEGGFGG